MRVQGVLGKAGESFRWFWGLVWEFGGPVGLAGLKGLTVV